MPTGSEESRTVDDDWAEIKKMLGIDWERPGWTAPRRPPQKKERKCRNEEDSL